MPRRHGDRAVGQSERPARPPRPILLVTVKRLAAFALTVVAAASLSGCTLLSPAPTDLSDQVDDLLAAAGVGEIGQVGVRDGTVSIVFDRDGEQFEGGREAINGGFEAADHPSKLTMVPPSALPLDAFERAYAEADDECDATVRASLTSTIGGAVVMSVSCGKGVEPASFTKTWIDGEPMPEFADWTSPEAIDAVLAEALAIIGPRVRRIEFDSRTEADDGADAVARIEAGPFGSVDGTGATCDQSVLRFLDSAPETVTTSDSMLVYGPCSAPGSGTPRDVTGLTGAQVLSAVATVTDPASAETWLLRFDDATASWVVDVYGAGGDPIDTAPIVP